MTSSYQQQLDAKVARISAQFAEYNPPALQVFASPEHNYRMRAEFRIWHIEDDLFYAMFERSEDKQKKVIRVDEFPIADRSINLLMPKLLAALKADPVLSARLFEVHFLATLSGEMLVSLLYHRKLESDWEPAAQALSKALNIKLIGRSRGQKFVLSDEYVVEQLQVFERTYTYKQIESSFTQPNAQVCQKMLEWACTVAEYSEQDLLELYCGNGNFTLPLSTRFRRVLATELAKSSVYAAQWNIEQNQIENIQVARLSAEEFTQAYNGEREFRRLQEANIDLASYDFDTVFVDPPRAGIDDDTLKLLQRFKRIIYISCNPDTLHDNLKTLCQSHKVTQFALFDQFPYTHHVESGVLLEKI
ncbi:MULTISPECIES: tRNA (uridine(54)-C5)-methyltransferase TrmA [Acinetobacter]|jgi:tRNA (uracil-5-)-methyltransferase|uniref:tRNA/tmRNA (uracil-C(5))-methyltransferase n=1 Tax=Acinetobacter towneri TaxID=202956 RepID=A0AAP9GUZ3_9GAMM|nr:MULTISPECIES: tRNA (uridine(54)-C5)-methyltransferase TrmA [Acinetobacter]MCA4798160.1 tRNA (uridine(54)-C5)-methyltransferase TrmA [Acinetobacter towneri]MCA4813910.1 tRNA (uridine(54)-C5)-methyltransferase TrmA [Acinetobacter towneri]MCO8057802.1 tRNA (uridine(54)-C5)-methyltransferase TrmA [Acinetobacter towneri]MCO8063448.1 tRNA (uridine(54)-C5)-methyltransferase TrmA [Acinetobacter towneri]MDD4851944.1 tRNA (uridine(54)-C5)-methyltransferase TrmA [Acinetobacter towneri]